MWSFSSSTGVASPCAEIQHSQGFGRNHKIQPLGLNSSAPVAALAAGDLRLQKGVGLFGDKGLKVKSTFPHPSLLGNRVSNPWPEHQKILL